MEQKQPGGTLRQAGRIPRRNGDRCDDHGLGIIDAVTDHHLRRTAFQLCEPGSFLGGALLSASLTDP